MNVTCSGRIFHVNVLRVAGHDLGPRSHAVHRRPRLVHRYCSLIILRFSKDSPKAPDEHISIILVVIKTLNLPLQHWII